MLLHTACFLSDELLDSMTLCNIAAEGDVKLLNVSSVVELTGKSSYPLQKKDHTMIKLIQFFRFQQIDIGIFL